MVQSGAWMNINTWESPKGAGPWHRLDARPSKRSTHPRAFCVLATAFTGGASAT